MAKRKTKSVNMATPAVAPDMKPRMYIDLRDEDVDLLKDIKVGQELCVVVHGKVVGLSAREAKYEEGKSKTGDIQLEDTEVELMTMGEYEALMEDD